MKTREPAPPDSFTKLALYTVPLFLLPDRSTNILPVSFISYHKTIPFTTGPTPDTGDGVAEGTTVGRGVGMAGGVGFMVAVGVNVGLGVAVGVTVGVTVGVGVGLTWGASAL